MSVGLNKMLCVCGDTFNLMTMNNFFQVYEFHVSATVHESKVNIYCILYIYVLCSGGSIVMLGALYQKFSHCIIQ